MELKKEVPMGNYPATTAELRVWAVNQVFNTSTQLLNDSNIDKAISMTEKIVEYVNQDNSIKRNDKSVDDALTKLLGNVTEIISNFMKGNGDSALSEALVEQIIEINESKNDDDRPNQNPCQRKCKSPKAPKAAKKEEVAMEKIADNTTVEEIKEV